ncbi:peptidase M50 [Sulfolobus sp. S-194]|uniref:peptidase M50 n=1 Tax=Sulfolobus sp. S-194 TaxID=2512240 RepID=UPI00143727DC|nr:peptidase M50 [Sulfolobus sp. S-194]QIW23009.1 peptidase M50 [Sulfolobus sp. S-194]
MSYIDYLEWRFRNLNEGLSFLLAILSLAVAFVGPHYLRYGVIVGVLIPIITATTAIVPHEIAHRQSARNYGCASRFTLSFKGFLATLLINLISGLTGFGFLVFVSGYTGIFCRFGIMTKDVEGKTAFAGPLTNLVIAILSLLSLLFIPISNIYLLYLLAEIFTFNSYVAFFNLIPLPPLDGQKVLRWNSAIWGVALIFALILTFVPYYVL